MGVGLPDFWISWSERSKGARHIGVSVDVNAGKRNRIFLVRGKGLILGGAIIAYQDVSQKEDAVGVIVDDRDFTAYEIEFLNMFGFTKNEHTSVFVQKYDDTNGVYAIGITRGLSFEKSFGVIYTEKNGVERTIIILLDYVLIE